MPRSTGTLRYMRQQGQQTRVRSQLGGVKSVRKLIRQLPASVKEEMADVLTDIQPEYLAAVKADTPVAAKAHREGFQPGALRAAIGAKVLRASLRLRVGLLGKRRHLTNFFYGRFVELGRKAQTVTVTRHVKKAAGRRLVRGTARVIDHKPYRMRVRAMAPRPFVYKKRTDLRARLSNRLGTLWEHALAHAGEGAGSD